MNLLGSVPAIALMGTAAMGKPIVSLLSAFGPDKVVFYDWDVVNYYYSLIKNFYDGYSWQVRVSYGLIVFSILLMIVLFFMFTYRVNKRKRREKKFKKISDKFREPFLNVLTESDPLMPSQIEEMCDCTRAEFTRYDAPQLVRLLVKLREELQEVIYIPNLNALCGVCGAQDFLENNLLNNRRVFETVQTLTTLNLRISEGRLANYVNHRNPNIRQMSRMSYMICTDMEPYRYLVEDLNEPMAAWRSMALHQLFGWLQACEKRMPNFITLVNRVNNPKVAAFIIQEIAYWGTDDERSKLDMFYMDERYDCRSAAFKAVAMMKDESQEQNLIDTYNSQPEPLRREILGAVYSIRSGKQMQFFSDVYHTSPSKETRELALTYLYDYSNESRRLFEHLRFENEKENRLLIDQIDSLNLLNQIRNYS